MSTIENDLLQKIEIDGDTVKYIFADPVYALGIVKNDLWVKCAGDELQSIPDEILLIPLILNIAPLIWASGKTFTLATMDEGLVNSLEDLKAILKNRYKEIDWSGRLIPVKTTKSAFAPSEQIAVLFSGGVDSTYTSLTNRDKNQILICIRGNDAGLSDDIKWRNKLEHTRRFAAHFGHDTAFVESNFTSFINGRWVRRRLPSLQSWWNNVQHGIGLVGLAAFPAWQKRIAHIYISSSFHKLLLDRISYRWGSDYIIDNAAYWSGQRANHYGEDKSRQDKIEYICNHGDQANWHALLVCNLRSKSDTNPKSCCLCKKCVRTMAGILVNGHHYRDFDFQLDDRLFRTVCIERLKNMQSIVDLERWQEIKTRLKSIEYYKSCGHSDDIIELLEFIRSYDLARHFRMRSSLLMVLGYTRRMMRMIKKAIPLFTNTRPHSRDA